MNLPVSGTANFALLGYGRFGEAFAQLLLQAGHQVSVWDAQAEVPEALAAASLNDAVKDAQWIVLAMPVPNMRDSLHTLRPLLHAGQIVLDVGSVKMHPCGAMDELLGDAIAHVGTHPLFGPLSLARDERPLRTVICASPRHPQAAERASELFVALGCEVIEQDPETHDRAMAKTHVLAFFIAKGLIDIGVDDGMPVAPPSFQGMKHMLAAVRGDAGHLFSAIQRENPFAASARAELLAELQRVHQQLLAELNDDDLAIPLPDASTT
ncbi:prephenate dehydrogenase/arogenate dehydrogenase family protein [Rhodanobacter sp. AS-Z3]|uniref:prephenate dehydrogenase/arogenate dehydrogenase family protein n=1 Tax=Rhodanobacter sp. AS-Z3 TaxID=3031330 RepID=UPI002479A8A5|nr:prephenate dehydrogenase/arogenate dehydrogenase family protein [Rhodanobacter sp. AS-Z3]WEN14515.1 prephenate dehydrogenase/arogenate dehydrogenase family protein [Rhodanobacter sp. AS-Z3]